MKTFEDLEFNTHPTGIGTRAVLNFNNGFGVSVIFGSYWYSDGVDTYEVAVMKNNDLCYTTHITDDVLGYQTKQQVTRIMKQVQEL